MAPICPSAVGTASTSAVAATASVARGRSGASERIMVEHRLRHHRDRHHLQPVQPAAAERAAERFDAIAERHHQQRRGQ